MTPRPKGGGGTDGDGARGAEPVISIRATLDVPGETRRQAVVFAIWVLCLAAAVFTGAAVGTHIPSYVSDPDEQQQELSRSRWARAKVALVLGLVCPALLTIHVSRRRRRGGPHARGIRLEITADGELRLWGRGYGTRLALGQARVDERLVDLYAGRLGSWRERRLSVTAGAHGIEIGTLASDEDDGLLPLLGGEGDCVEFERSDYLRLRVALESFRSRV
ncbi:MAG TPA: hypothetical protein VJT73_01130 [Polyangiaceae bacterium]|nr:hypothetical protein [Polyangiaceae bacterium]